MNLSGDILRHDGHAAAKARSAAGFQVRNLVQYLRGYGVPPGRVLVLGRSYLRSQPDHLGAYGASHTPPPLEYSQSLSPS